MLAINVNSTYLVLKVLDKAHNMYYTRTHTHTHGHTQTYTRAYTRAYTHTHTQTRAHTQIHTHTHNKCTQLSYIVTSKLHNTKRNSWLHENVHSCTSYSIDASSVSGGGRIVLLGFLEGIATFCCL